MSAEQRNLGKYRLIERLAHGGMGEVWKALDTQLQRYVAIKLLRPDWLDDADFVARFEREAQLIASLHHPNIVKIHNFHVSRPPESEDVKVYMVMDYVEGQTLADYIRNTSRRGAWPSAADILAIFTGTSLALDYAHQQGMIHRDIKPANILLDQRVPTPGGLGIPILTDFGIARLQGVSAGTAVGAVVGTPLYMAPEQAMGLYDDKRSDLYALGIILYEMLTGVTPFRGDSYLAIIMQHLHEVPTPPALINPRVTPELSAVVLKSIAKKPEERFATAAALTTALAQALHMPVPAPFLLDSGRGAANGLSGELRRIQPSSSSGTGAFTPIQSGPATNETPGSLDLQRQQQAFNQRARARANPVTPILPEMWTQQVVQQAGQQTVPSAQEDFFPPLPTEVQQLPTRQEVERAPLKRPARLTKWRLALIALVIVLLAAGLGTFALATSQGGSNAVVGQIRLSKSANSKNYDILQIDLQNIPNPPAGYVYYAWIESPENESDVPNWQVQVSQGAIHAANLRYPRVRSLLVSNGLFLITKEQAGGLPPIVPSPGAGARVYYAQMPAAPSSASLVFSVRSCPSNPNDTTCVG